MARMSVEESGKKPQKAAKGSGASPAKIGIVVVGLLVGGLLIVNSFTPIFGGSNTVPKDFKPMTAEEKSQIAEEAKKEEKEAPRAIKGGA